MAIQGDSVVRDEPQDLTQELAVLTLGLLNPRANQDLLQVLDAATGDAGSAAATFAVAYASSMEDVAMTHEVQPCPYLADMQRATMESGAPQELSASHPSGRSMLAGLRIGGTPVLHLLMAPVRSPNGESIGTISLFYTQPIAEGLDPRALIRSHAAKLEERLAQRLSRASIPESSPGSDSYPPEGLPA